MKNIFLAFVLAFIAANVNAQTTTLQFTADKEVLLNDQMLDSKTTLKEIKAVLGEPMIYKEYTATEKVNYHYPELGLTVHTVKDKLLFIGANLNWDGDKNFPETSYTGALSIDGVKIDTESTDAFLNEITAIEIECPFPSLCMTNPRKDRIAIIIGFKESIVTQVGFEFH
jgi:hypothetical protein